MPALLLQDTSVLINLLATDRFDEIASTTQWQFAICKAVQDETKSIWNPETNQREVISLLPFINRGLLLLLDLDSAEELEAHIQLCSLPGLGEGEAMCIALARSRQIEFATDDRKAARVYLSDHPVLMPVSTPEILLNWQKCATMAEADMGRLITRIEVRAKFTLSPNHPHFVWWQRQKLSIFP
jgi:predicted nucleic acid-binding protein